MGEGVKVSLGVGVGGVLVMVDVLLLVGVREKVVEGVNERVGVRTVAVGVLDLVGVSVLEAVCVLVGLGPGVLV